MAYDKSQLQVLGQQIFETGKAVSDGFQLDKDSAEISSLIMAFMSCVDEFTTDLDAAACHTGAALLDSVGDWRVNPPTTEG